MARKARPNEHNELKKPNELNEPNRPNEPNEPSRLTGKRANRQTDREET